MSKWNLLAFQKENISFGNVEMNLFDILLPSFFPAKNIGTNFDEKIQVRVFMECTTKEQTPAPVKMCVCVKIQGWSVLNEWKWGRNITGEKVFQNGIICTFFDRTNPLPRFANARALFCILRDKFPVLAYVCKLLHDDDS